MYDQKVLAKSASSRWCALPCCVLYTYEFVNICLIVRVHFRFEVVSKELALFFFIKSLRTCSTLVIRLCIAKPAFSHGVLFLTSVLRGKVFSETFTLSQYGQQI